LGLLVENDKAKLTYGSLIQNFNRWLLSTFSTEAVVDGKTHNVRSSDMSDLSLESAPSAIDQVLGIQLKTTNTCSACDFTTSRNGTVQAVDLTYPRKVADTPSFAELLRQSIIRESSTRAACPNCKQFVPLLSQRKLANPTPKGLPAVISINAMVSGTEIFDVWKDKKIAKETQYYVPSQVGFMPTPEGDLVADEKGVVYDVKVSCSSAHAMRAEISRWSYKCKKRLTLRPI
jgi:PAB-dependent poly(A)-specific ribonuclease subunit 2